VLTLITGTPGAGKTAYAVSELRELLEKHPRPVVVMGIPELTLPHEVAPPVEEWVKRIPSPEDPTVIECEFTFPEGALVIIDEAQKIFRPRGTGSKVPDHVAAFEKHRHRGLDFWLITQHPNLLDTNVRRLVGKHIHLRGHWAGRELIEWAEASDPESRSDRAVGVRQRYKLPASAFRLYKSASLHVKQKRRIPKAIFLFLGVVLVGAFLGWRAFDRVADAIKGEDRNALAASQSASPYAVSGSPAGGAARVSGSTVTVAPLTMAAFQPRLLGRPESAPLYDGIREVVAMPAVVGCVEAARRCSCFTGQATDAGLSDAECRAWLKSPPFSPFRAVFPATVVAERKATPQVQPPPAKPGFID